MGYEVEEKIEARVTPEKVWQMWERAHLKQGHGEISKGQKGKHKFHYQILDVEPGKYFSILWKTLFVRIIFRHSVVPISKGCEIRYQVQIKGPFAWLVRWFLGEKIRKNVSYVLKTIVRQLEEESAKESYNR